MSEQAQEQPPLDNSGKRRWRVSRRGFLIGAGAVAGGLALGALAGLPALRLQLAEVVDSGGGGFGGQSNDPLLWFEVNPDNRITLFVPKVEMGQGVHTALKQIAVEELGVPWDSVAVQQGTTAVGPQDSSGTSGSTSVAASYTPLREAAAALREMLRVEAAAQLGVPAATLMIDGAAFVTAEGASRTFGEVVAAKSGDWEVAEEEALLKTGTANRVVGQSLPRNDIPDKVTGTAVYGFDARLPGMKYGAVLRSPTIQGRLLSVNPVPAEAMPGVVAVVSEEGFAGIVADSRPQAWAALAALEAEWDEGKLWSQAELEELVSVGGPGGVSIQVEGNSERTLSSGAPLVAEYRTPLRVHTPLEAQAALADVQGERARVWTSTQAASRTQGLVAEVTGLAEEAIEIIPTYLGGGFGRKLGDVAVEAARLSQGAGLPVHVGWNRPEELRDGYFAPLTHHRLQGAVDANGRIQALKHEVGSGDILFAFFPAAMAAAFGADIGVTRGARIEYDVPNRHVVVWRRELPIATGSWRGLGLLPNIFAIESFMDELAHGAGIDPLQFRLQNLATDGRGAQLSGVLKAATTAAGWGTPRQEGRALGLACCYDYGTAVAAVAEVSVDAETGQVRVHHVTTAMDCGLVINPDGARAQMEGNAIWGVGSALLEEARVENGRVALNNFDTYPLLTMKEAPTIEAILVNSGVEEPSGVGEPPIGPIAPAIANAIFAQTGKRLRQMPFTPERVLAA